MNCANFDGADFYCLLSKKEYTALTPNERMRCFRHYKHMMNCGDCYEDFGHVLEDSLRESSEGAILRFWLNMHPLDAELFRSERSVNTLQKLK